MDARSRREEAWKEITPPVKRALLLFVLSIPLRVLERNAQLEQNPG